MGTFKLRSVVSLAFNSGRVGLIVPKESRSLLSRVPVSARCGRGAHAQALTDNIRYITNHADKLQLDPTTMRLDKQSKKPLCIMLCWFLARPDHVMKYATLYLKQGYHMKAFHTAATAHYIRSSQLFHSTLCRAPALFLLSRSDPVGAEKSNRSVHDSWASMGVKCTWKCWDKSPHVQHYTFHRKEYLEALYAHLDAYGLVSQPEKMRMRL